MDRFIIVDSHNSEYIGIIFHILRKCGYNMALTKRLFHWIPSYSKRNIRRDWQTKTVVLVWNEELNDYTSTFQMYKNSDSSLYIRKIATLPQYEGKGIGKRNLLYIEQFAIKNGCSRICLDVYIKSKGAISFYSHLGFKEVGTKRSIRFKELIMKKQLD